MRIQSLSAPVIIACIGALLAFASPAYAGGRQGPTDGLRNVNGTQLYCTTMGKGPTLVILHGGPGLDHTYLLPQMAELARHFRLIFFDQRGAGRSTVELDTNSMTLQNFLRDVEGIRQSFHLGRMNLLGHSWGGLLAMFYAIQYPDHLNSLILVDPSPATSALRDSSFRTMLARTAPQDSVARAEITGSEGFRKRDPAVMARFFRVLFRGSFYDRRLADSLTLTLPPDFPAQSVLYRHLARDPMVQNYDLSAGLRMIRCSTLILAGDHDPVPAAAFQHIHREIRRSTLVIIPHCGHFPFIEAPSEFFTTVTSFLGRAK